MTLKEEIVSRIKEGGPVAVVRAENSDFRKPLTDGMDGLLIDMKDLGDFSFTLSVVNVILIGGLIII